MKNTVKNLDWKAFIVALFFLFMFTCLCITSHGQEREQHHVNLRPLLPPAMQFVDRILRPCPSGTTPYVSAIAAADGDLDLTACQGRSVTINGVPIVGTGNVVGPASATDNAITRFDGTTGKLIQNSLAILADSGNISTPGTVTTGSGGGVNGAIDLKGLTSGIFTQTVKSIAGTWQFTWPDNDGNASDCLKTDGSGIGSWGSCTGAGTVTGSGTTNALPKWTNGPGSVLGDSRVTDNGTTIDANSGAGIFQAGDTGALVNNSYLKIDDANFAVNLRADNNGSTSSVDLFGGGSPQVTISSGSGSVISMSGNTITLSQSSTSLVLDSSASTATIAATTIKPSANGATDLGSTTRGYKQAFFDATITAGGTIGAQTINKSAGSVNFAAAASSLVVTSNKVTTSSIVMCTVATNDTTLKSVQCVAAAGSFTMFANAAATAETRVNFWVLNQ